MSKTITVFFVALAYSFCTSLQKPEEQPEALNNQPVTAYETIADTIKINPSLSKIYWRGTKMKGIGKHEGEVQLQQAFLIRQGGQLTGGRFVVAMQTIEVTDIPKTDPIPIKNLTQHLKNADFFDVDHYPLATFVITQVKKLEKGHLKIRGNLMLKGVTRQIEFIAIYTDRLFSTRFAFNRFLWNIGYKGSWADRTLVDRDIELGIELQTE